MTQASQAPLYSVRPDEKVANVQVYTSGAIIRGELVVKKSIRVSTWLKTNIAPDRICLYNSRVVPINAGPTIRASAYSELNIATSAIQAFHLLLPDADPIDYDPDELNRYMQPVTVMIANFLIRGNLRLATNVTVTKFLEVTRETFTSIYDANITNLFVPSLGTFQVPYVVIRQESSVFAVS